MGKAQRWDKATKKYTDVDCPFIIKEYNAHMGGVDLLDAHIARCKPTIRSRRWYIILFWHFVSVGMINSWLLYKRDCALHGITGASVLTLRQFQSLVAQGLIEVATTRRHGRPSLTDESSPQPQKIIRAKPCENLRFDQIAHWPVKGEKCRRCGVCKSMKTDTYCEKCNIPLCFNESRNCFNIYHIK